MSPLLTAYLFLSGAIVAEVTGTMLLQKTAQFTKLGPTLSMALCYVLSFYLLSHALKALPLGIAYAIWGGVGIVLTLIISVTVFKQSLDWQAITGVAMIVGGVVMINAFSKAAAH
ncbi:DMT family transporter [Stenotrophomonas rhizophila]|uniref:DMT family transporter n=1 Tax=Stenotrophomonas rhizophila TaxID=216778 RepID=UPI0010C0820A|nr:multidrug efflux SMR transporter [Stenotrophomonas rhizophila]MDY0954202.1 multidrug efflux SMR transporter [Stenotrophomonas rhizophila]TKK02982.1 QacE family quaternary ammonium compound efflux SMR transporter [Stenotrophomonas rhizophila]